jgi:peptide/nickel transport system substrate-binding protein
MKRFLSAALVLILALSAVMGSVSAQEAPEGTWYGTWPYVLPPDHHLNGFASGGPNSNLGVLYRGMVELTPAFYMWATDEWMPMLAESWGFVEDNTAYEITLRPDALWSNGDAVTADDLIVTYALGRIVGWSQFNYISEVVKVDDQTVRFVFTDQPSKVAERLLLKEYVVARATYGELAQEALDLVATGATSADQAWTDLRTKINEFRPEELVASGPFTYTLADVGDAYMTLTWQPNSIYSATTQFGALRLWAGETDATTPLVLSGELAHSTNVYPPTTIQAFEDAGVALVTIPRGYGPGLLMQHDVYPFNIKEVRQAMAYAINRDQNAFLTNGIGGAPTIYMSGLLDENVPVLLTEEAIGQLNQYPFDLDMAAAKMEEASFTRNADGKWADAEGNLISVEYKFPAEFADFSAASQDAINQLNDFGFDITARAIPWQENAADIRAGNFQLSVWSWASASPFASRQFFGPMQRFNYVGLTDGQIGMNFPMEFEYNGAMIDLNAMINEASNGLDVEAQKARASEIALILNDLMPYIPLNIILSVEPLNANLISGAPAEGDPILANPSGSGDHFAIWMILNGTLTPGPDA